MVLSSVQRKVIKIFGVRIVVDVIEKHSEGSVVKERRENCVSLDCCLEDYVSVSWCNVKVLVVQVVSVSVLGLLVAVG